MGDMVSFSVSLNKQGKPQAMELGNPGGPALQSNSGGPDGGYSSGVNAAPHILPPPPPPPAGGGAKTQEWQQTQHNYAATQQHHQEEWSVEEVELPPGLV